MFRRITRPAAVLALAGLTSLAVPRAGPAQSAAPGTRSPNRTIALAPAAAPPATRALKPSYRVRLTSTWAQEAGPAGCLNGGEETVEGTLARTADGGYAGSFTRRTHLLFCGAHGRAQGAPAESCALALEGQGEVGVTGEVVADETSPSGRSARVTWTPEDSGSVAVTGACPPAFQEAVATMYRTTRHGVEFPLTTMGEGPHSERLENYAWRVELE